MGLQLFIDRRPGSVVSLSTQHLLNGVQQMVGEDRDEDVSVAAMLTLMEDRPNTEGGFQIPKRSLDALQHHVQAPQPFGVQVVSVGFEHVHPVKQLGLGAFLLVDAPLEFQRSSLLGERSRKEPRGALVALPSAPDAFDRLLLAQFPAGQPIGDPRQLLG